MGLYVEYSNSFNIVNYIEYLRFFLNSSNDIDTLAWINNYLSIATADTDGLDNWGRILGRDRVVPVGDDFDYVLGFADPVVTTPPTPGYSPNPNTLQPGTESDYYKNYVVNMGDVERSQSTVYGGGFYSNAKGGDNTTLTDDAYRPLLQLLYSKYSSNNTLASMNAIIKAYALQTGRTKAQIDGTYATENTGNSIMTVLYSFNFPLLPYEINLFENLNVLPKPTGVSITVDWLG